MAEKHVVILGGGITGLAVAYNLKKLAIHQGIPLRCTLFERDVRFGGKIKTYHTDDMTLELGPDSIFTPKLKGIDIIQELGIQEDLIPINSGRTDVVHGGRLCPLPSGLMFGIPSDFQSFSITRLISVRGKLRALGDLVMPYSPMSGDQSLGEFLQKRVGNEIVDVIAAPLLAGIYAADINRMSLNTTMPALRKLYDEHHSLIRGILAQRKQRNQIETDTKSPIFVSLRDGLESLVERLVACLHNGVELVPQAEAQRIDTSNKGGYDVSITRWGSQFCLHADAVVITTPAYQTAKLLKFLPINSHPLHTIRYVSTATILLGYPKERVIGLSGSGFLVPRSEPVSMTACTVVSNKWPHAVRDSKTVLRCYLGRDGEDGLIDTLDDDSIVEEMSRNIEHIIGKVGKPAFHLVTKWPKSMPQYDVGHMERIQMIELELQRIRGIELAGSGYRGVGIPDCLRDASRAATRIINFLAN